MSSSDEDERLKAALDPSLMSADLYCNEKKENTEDESKHKLKSLRRDKNEDENVKVMSELDVTPGFQEYVAKQLDKILADSIEEAPLLGVSDDNKVKELDASERGGGIRLLRKSNKSILTTKIEINQRRPNLLKHRMPPDIHELRSEDLEGVSVTTKQVLAKEGTEYYANKFASRVEEGIARIKNDERKKAKKKLLKKEKKIKDRNKEANLPQSNNT